MTLTSAAILLFFVLDPFGSIPLLLSTLRPVPQKRRRRVVARELALALVVLVAFLFAGPVVVPRLGLSQPALGLAGALILLLVAIRMVFPPHRGGDEEPTEEPFLVPIAIPYVAGPAAMATILLLVQREPERRLEWLVAVGLAWFGCALVLFFAAGLARLLGRRGLIALERLMGMLLTAIAVQMFLDGWKQFGGG